MEQQEHLEGHQLKSNNNGTTRTIRGSLIKEQQQWNNNNIKRITLSEKQQGFQIKDSRVPLKIKKNNS